MEERFKMFAVSESFGPEWAQRAVWLFGKNEMVQDTELTSRDLSVQQAADYFKTAMVDIRAYARSLLAWLRTEAAEEQLGSRDDMIGPSLLVLFGPLISTKGFERYAGIAYNELTEELARFPDLNEATIRCKILNSWTQFETESDGLRLSDTVLAAAFILFQNSPVLSTPAAKRQEGERTPQFLQYPYPPPPNKAGK